MIIGCCITDVFAGVALMYEIAEQDLMKIPPRDVKRDRLVTAPLIVYSYLFYGTLEVRLRARACVRTLEVPPAACMRCVRAAAGCSARSGWQEG